MVCVPVPLNVTLGKVATPDVRLTGVPPFRLIVVEPTVSVKVAVPVGVVPGLVESVSVAVIVTAWPAVTALGLTNTAVAVVSGIGTATPVDVP